MCEPVTIAYAAAAVIGAYGAVQQGQASKAQASYQAQVSRNNQILANRAADDAIERGRTDEKRQRLQTSRMIGTQRAQFAANGVVVDEGSALDVIGDTAALGEIDALTIRDNAAREAYNYRVQAQSQGDQAGLLAAQGKNAVTSSYLSAGSSLLSSGGQAADKWYQYKKVA